VIETQAATVALAARLADEAGAMPPLVNLGGGFGIPYFPGDVPLDVEAVGAALAGELGKLDTHYAIELGRWLVGEAGVYLARVVDRKESQGETFLIVDGGLNHHLAATGNFGTVVRATIRSRWRTDARRRGGGGHRRRAALHPARPAGRPRRAARGRSG
jgi:diaminopimelate decarboxylase